MSRESIENSGLEELKAAVCASKAAQVEEVLAKHTALREQINDPLPNYSFGLNAL